LNETPHHFLRRFSRRIIASTRFSHSLDPERTLRLLGLGQKSKY
jgi:hypothetical protein